MQKKGFILIVVIIVALFLGIGYFINNVSNKAPGPPALTVSEEVGDLGQIKPDKEQTYVFTLKNEGGENLVIERVQAPCGCTATLLLEDELQPGKTTQLEVTFNPRGYQGVVTQSVYIYSNDPEIPRKGIAIRADVEHIPSPEIRISENLWDLGLLTRGDSDRLALIISNKGDLSLDIERLDVPDYIHYDREVLELPKELVPEEEIEIDFTFDSSERETGVVREYIRLVTSDPMRRNITLRIEGYIKEQEKVLSIYPLQSILLTGNEEKDVYEAKFLLKNNSEDTLQIASVQSSVDYLNPITQEISLSPGQEQEIIIRIDREKMANQDIEGKLQEYIYINIALPVSVDTEIQ